MGEINVTESIEWLCDSRPHIALARVSSLREEAKSGTTAALGRLTELHTQRTLKGNPASTSEFHGSPVSSTAVDASPVGPNVLSAGSELILFFAPDGRIDYAINLTNPTAETSGIVVTLSFAVLRDRETILESVENRLSLRQANETPRPDARNTDTPQRTFLRFEVPPDTDAYRSLFGGSTCYLVVPADPQFKDKILAHTYCPEPWERARATYQLGSYAAPEVIQRLHVMLADPISAVVKTVAASRSGEKIVYPSRQVAYDVLVELGTVVNRPVGYVDDFPYALVRLGSNALSKTAR